MLFRSVSQSRYDIFSNSQWEKHKAYAYNVDYWSGAGTIGLVTDMVQLRYANYPKDYFMGMLPSSQYGSVAVLPGVLSPSDNPSRVYAFTSGTGSVGSILNSPSSTAIVTNNTSTSTRYAVLNPSYRDWETDRKSTRLNSSHRSLSRMPSSA